MNITSYDGCSTTVYMNVRGMRQTTYLAVCSTVRAVSVEPASCSTSCWMPVSTRWRCDGSNSPSDPDTFSCSPPASLCCSSCCRCSACISSISRRCSLSCCCCCSSNCCWARWRCSKLLMTNPPLPRPGRDRADCVPVCDCSMTHPPLPSCTKWFFTATSWTCRRVTYNYQSRLISPVQQWQSTLRNWRFCQVQSHVTQKLQYKKYKIQIWNKNIKIGPDQI